MRPDWHEYFLAIAKLISTRSTCNSRPTGAVIVRDKQILTTGYNGSVPDAPHCTDQVNEDGSSFCFRRSIDAPEHDKYNFCRSSHAEANAIAQAARLGVALEGATLYATLAPCYVCTKLLAVAKIKHVYYESAYGSTNPQRDEHWKRVINEAGIETFEQLNISEKNLSKIIATLTNNTSNRRLGEMSSSNNQDTEKAYNYRADKDFKEMLRRIIGGTNTKEGNKLVAPINLCVRPINTQWITNSNREKAINLMASLNIIETVNISSASIIAEIVGSLISNSSKEVKISRDTCELTFAIRSNKLQFNVTVDQIEALDGLPILMDSLSILYNDIIMNLIDRSNVTLQEGNIVISIAGAYIDTQSLEKANALCNSL